MIEDDFLGISELVVGANRIRPGRVWSCSLENRQSQQYICSAPEEIGKVVDMRRY